MVNSVQDLRQLLELLEEKGVVSFRFGELEMSLAPAFARAGVAPEDDEEVDRRGMTLSDRVLMGIA